jgi:hypothetical protein
MLLGTQTTGFLRAATAAFAAEIPGAHVVELSGQAHQAIDFAPTEIVRLVLEFDSAAA